MTSDVGVGLDEGKHLVQRSHGYAIAELAMAIPALLIIVAMSVSLVGITVTQIQLESESFQYRLPSFQTLLICHLN